MNELVLYGVPAVGLVIVLVELAKHYGLDARWAPLGAIGCGLVLAVLAKLATMWPAFDAWLQVGMIGLITGLIAAGLYSGVKATRGQ